MTPQEITAVTSVPSDAPSAISPASATWRVEGGSVVYATGQATMGSGVGYLLRWDLVTASWKVWGADAAVGAVTINASSPSILGGLFCGRWSTGDQTTGDYCFLVGGGPTLTGLVAGAYDV